MLGPPSSVNVNAWNYLPRGTVNFSSLGVFKRSIQLVDFSEFLKCYVVRLYFVLMFDVGAQLLALYFSLVVLFDSHICRLFWCFITVNGFFEMEIKYMMMMMMK